jgi:hypothetical protein
MTDWFYRVRLRVWTAATDGHIVLPPDDMNWRATVEWYWQEKTEELGEKPVPVPICPPQIPHWLTQASAVRGWRRTAWAMAQPYCRWQLQSVIKTIHRLLNVGVDCTASNERVISEWWTGKDFEVNGLGLISIHVSTINCYTTANSERRPTLRLGCNIVWTCRYIPAFWKNVLHTSQFQPRRWRQHVPTNLLCLFTSPHGVTIQNTNMDIFTSVRTSNQSIFICLPKLFPRAVFYRYKTVNYYFHIPSEIWDRTSQ